MRNPGEISTLLEKKMLYVFLSFSEQYQSSFIAVYTCRHSETFKHRFNISGCTQTTKCFVQVGAHPQILRNIIVQRLEHQIERMGAKHFVSKHTVYNA